MNAVWSFWSKPYRAHYHHAWYSELHHLLAWVLSVQTARQHFEELHLYTDDAGARLLVDGIGLPFTRISTELNTLDACDPDWWALGKVQTYRLQTEPFIHLDADVFLWKPISEHLANADVFSQSIEPLGPQFAHYQPEQMEKLLAIKPGGWLPDEWRWFRQAGVPQHGECCGVLGGNHVDFIRHYADLAFRLVTDPANQFAWQHLRDKRQHMLSVEQYLLAACVDYHAMQPGSAYRGVALERFFVEPGAPYNSVHQTRVGYTHLAGGIKHNESVARHLADQVRSDYPQEYKRCSAIAQESTVLSPSRTMRP